MDYYIDKFDTLTKATIIMTHASLLAQLEAFKKAKDLTAIEALAWSTN